MWWSDGMGIIEIKIALDQARSCSHSGPCDADIEALSKEPEIAEQLAAIDPAKLRRVLGEYGAWDKDELDDHDQNLQRVLWCACNDLAEENTGRGSCPNDSRLDLYGALYLLCTQYHSGQDSRGYRITSRLIGAGYEPGRTLQEHNFESDEQRQIYKKLWRKYRQVL